MPTNYQAIADENTRRFGTDIDEYGPRLLANRYSDRTHFVYELLQNAEDAIGWRVEEDGDTRRSVVFHLTRDALHFRHSGLPFAEKHVRGICDIGKGTKRQELTAIGKHGIGFKSVYAYTHHPEIHSGEEHFVIESFVRPREAAFRPTPPDETLFVLPFDHPEIGPAKAHAAILSRFRKLGLKTLLFLRHVESIEWDVESGDRGHYLRESRPLGHDLQLITLLGQSGTQEETVQERWMVVRKAVFDVGKPAGFVEVAFQVEPNEAGSKRRDRDRVIRATDSPLVVFFPTEKETHLGFLIQGPYLRDRFITP